MLKIIEQAHHLLSQTITSLDVVIDATAGKGKDTLFLASISKKVYSFDIQEEAIKQTKQLLEKYNLNNVELICDSHENIDKYVFEQVVGVIFNLGYLPDGDKSITTKAESTIIAINKVLPLLKIKGLVTIVVYPGHTEGAKESSALLDFLKNLDQKVYNVGVYAFLNWKNTPPYLIVIERIK